MRQPYLHDAALLALLIKTMRRELRAQGSGPRFHSADVVPPQHRPAI